LALPTTKLYRDSAGTIREAVETDGAGSNAPTAMNADMDTNGNPVPTYKAHTYTYYGAGQVHSDTVTDGVNTWVKTFMYENGQQVSDSGWVKQ